MASSAALLSTFGIVMTSDLARRSNYLCAAQPESLEPGFQCPPAPHPRLKIPALLFPALGTFASLSSLPSSPYTAFASPLRCTSPKVSRIVATRIDTVMTM